MQSSSRVIKDLRVAELGIWELEVRKDFVQRREPHDEPQKQFLMEQVLAERQAVLDKAQEEAVEILAQAQKEKERIRQEAFDQGYQEGYETGYREGYQAGEAKAQELIRKKAQLVAQLQELHRNLYKEAEEHMVQLALEIAQKILRKQVEMDPQVVLEVAKATLQEAHAGETYFLYVNPQDLKRAAKGKDDLYSQIPPGATLQIIADPDVSPGGCRVETEVGSTDGTLESQLAQLAEKLKAKAKEASK